MFQVQSMFQVTACRGNIAFVLLLCLQTRTCTVLFWGKLFLFFKPEYFEASAQQTLSAYAGLIQTLKRQSCLAFFPVFSLSSSYHKSFYENIEDQTMKPIKLNNNLSMLAFSRISIPDGDNLQQMKDSCVAICIQTVIAVLLSSSCLPCSYFFGLDVCNIAFSCVPITVYCSAVSRLTNFNAIHFLHISILLTVQLLRNSNKHLIQCQLSEISCPDLNLFVRYFTIQCLFLKLKYHMLKSQKLCKGLSQ